MNLANQPDFEDAPAEWELENPLDDATRQELEARERARRPTPLPDFEPDREQPEWSERKTARLLAGREPEWEPDHRRPNRELDRRMSVSPDAQQVENQLVYDELGVPQEGGFTIEYGGTNRGGTGRNADWAKATKVISPDDPASCRYVKIGNDEDAIRDLLTRNGHTMEYYRPALARGRPTAESKKIGSELRQQLRELVAMGANQSAIARVLGIREETVSRWLA